MRSAVSPLASIAVEVLAGVMHLLRKRAYDTAESSDGFRVLVDRLWPHGVAKADAAIDLWAKDTAPSPDLRKDWHAASDDDWGVYAERYSTELENETASALEELAAELRRHDIVTLVYASRDVQHNHAVVLEQALRELL